MLGKAECHFTFCLYTFLHIKNEDLVHYLLAAGAFPTDASVEEAEDAVANPVVVGSKNTRANIISAVRNARENPRCV